MVHILTADENPEFDSQINGDSITQEFLIQELDPKDDRKRKKQPWTFLSPVESVCTNIYELCLLILVAMIHEMLLLTLLSL
jgi:hypothetical protein